MQGVEMHSVLRRYQGPGLDLILPEADKVALGEEPPGAREGGKEEGPRGREGGGGG